MPNREGGYGGYRQDPRRSGQSRKVNSPGTGGVHRMSADPLTGEKRRDGYYRAPYAPRQGGDDVRPARYDPNGLEEDWVRAEEVVPTRSPETEHSGDTDVRPSRRRSDPARQQAARQRRRARRRMLLACTAAGILVVSGVVTLVLPEGAKTPPSQMEKPEVSLADRLVAPLPYGGGDGSGSAAPAVDWGTVGPVRQTENYTYTALPAESGAVPEFGRVTTEWFSDAAFLGDSLTVGYVDYDIDLSGARILAYEGASPNNFVNRTTLKNASDEEEIPLDILAAEPPAKLYLLVGTNALASGTSDEGFLNYYGRLLDDLKTILPDTMIFVQSVLPVRPEAAAESPGMATEHLNAINSAIRDMCADKGCYYLDLASAFTDTEGNLIADYAQPDGIHLTVSGYNNWVTYLCTHVPYNKDNPYQAGSTYYLDDSIKQLLTDLP